MPDSLSRERPSGVLPAPVDPGFPSRVLLVMDRSSKLFSGGTVLTGGDPPRVMRLSHAGRDVVNRMQVEGAGDVPSARRLARRLTDAGVMHPRPRTCNDAATRVTVVIPVLDRPVQLSRCLHALCDRRTDSDLHVIVVDDGSSDATAISGICDYFEVELIRLDKTLGPAAARNAGIQRADRELIAFIDSDCLPQDELIDHLAGHFVDPLVAAVAPRIVGHRDSSANVVARFSAAYSPLDLAQHPARVMPGGRVSYVPSAVLMVRRAAIDAGFDPTLRFGEDVDLVWQLHDAGWRVRYDPSVAVGHPEPRALAALLKRRFRYGTGAAPLAVRHPDRLAPLLIAPWSAALVTAALARRPVSTATIAAAQILPLARRIHAVGVPAHRAALWPLAGAGHTFLATGRALTALTPGLLVAGATYPRTRRTSLALLVCPPLYEWGRRRPPLDPVRWTALAIADNVAYGTGLWAGSIKSRTLAAVLPKIRGPADRGVRPGS